MKRLAALSLLAVLVAACGQDPSARASRDGEPSTASSVTTTTVKAEIPDAATTTTTTVSPHASVAPDDEIITGIFYPTGTPVPVALPDGAIGPNEWISKEGGTLLGDMVDASTYRLRTMVSIPSRTDGQGFEDYVFEVDVIEGATEDDAAISFRWVVSDVPEELAVVLEAVLIDGRQYRRDQGGDWFDNTGGPLFGMVAPPVVYSVLHDLSPQISAADWLGNEEIDGIPVGRYRWSTSQDMRSIPTSDWGAMYELWVDAEGVVWRVLSETYAAGNLLWSFDTVLYDVGADIEIEVPTIP